ncbi:MAG: uroporphyrinogen decarboxylase family protein [Bacteroidota bacterium]
MITKREWIAAILDGDKSLPVAQDWMGFFNSKTAKRLTSPQYHYDSMWWYDVPDKFDMGAMGPEQLDRMIAFNNSTGRCFACLGKGANISFGHGGPGEFFVRIKERHDKGFIAEFETGVLAEIHIHPHFYHSYGHPVKTMDDLNRLELPDPADPKRYRGFEQDAKYLKSKGEYVLASLNGFFSGLHYFFMEYQDVLLTLLTDPELIHVMLNRLGEWNLTAAEKMVEAGADCITFCDDLGSKESLLFSPEQYRTFIKPWHKKLCNRIHEMGATVHIHTHGAIRPILDDLVECGFDFINPFDPEEGWDIEEVLRDYSDKFVVVGGFPTKFWYWPSAQQHTYLRKMAGYGKKYGRLIFMDSGGVPEDVSREDFERISEVSRKVRGVEGVPGCV